MVASAMAAMRKITVEVPAETLEAALSDGGGVAETVREALEMLVRRRAYDRLLAMRGKLMFESTWQELRGKDDEG